MKNKLIQSFLKILLEAFTALYNIAPESAESALKELTEQVEAHKNRTKLKVVEDEKD